jgi:cytosine/adenosine deaminase-related metal-dependent hydrolase
MSDAPRVSRRRFLAGGAGIAAGSLAASTPIAAFAGEAPRPAPRRWLLKNGVVLTLDPKLGDFDRADVLIDGDRIAAVGPNLAAEGAQVVDASRMIVMPGFIDTHHHNYQGQLRNVLANGTLADYFRDIQGVTPKYRPEDAYIGELTSALRSIDAGVTMVTDTSQVSHSPAHTDACIQGLTESGIRSLFAYSPGVGPNVAYPGDIDRIAKRWFQSKDQLLTLALNCPVNGKVWEVGRQYGVRVFAHSVRGSVSSPDNVEKLGREGLVRSDNTFIHFTGANAAQMKMLADAGASLSLAVPIEMGMRHGMPPIQLALDHKVRISLSSDVATTMTADMFTQMRSTYTLQRVLLNERSLEGEKDLPPLLTTRDVLRFATIEGAHANGIAERTGSLTPGKYADVILLRTDRPNVLVLNNAAGAVVTNMDTSNVDTVFIGGRLKKRNGALVGVDLARVAREAARSRDYLFAAQGWPRSPTDNSLPGH